MKVASLCSGFGGLEMAISEVFPDSEISWFAEIDPGASKVLEARFPGIPNYGDLREIDYSAVEPVDLITAGFPCTDVSQAGVRAGLTRETRTGLWYEVLRAIRELRPERVLLENVMGLFTAQSDRRVESCEGCMGDGSAEHVLRAFAAVGADLAEARYDCRWTTVRASDVGAPHRRERVFIWAAPHAECV